MNVLVIPMFARSRMGGPWSRAQAIAAAFERTGHTVVLGVADDGNCTNPCVENTLQLPVPSPLGLPPAISSKTFPLAEKLGISGRKPVKSFEEVLWLTGALAYAYGRESVDIIRDAIATHKIDAVYSEYSLPAIIAARAAGMPAFGSFSLTTQASYASDPDKSGGVRRLLGEVGLPGVTSALDLFGWLTRRFVPSCYELEPIEDDAVEFVGFLREPPAIGNDARDCVVVYLGAGSVPQQQIERTVTAALADFDGAVYVAGCNNEHQEGNIRFAPRFDFSQLLPRARCFIHHGGQNSTMDALLHGAPQVIVPGRVFERIYNAESIERAGAGVKLTSFAPSALREACEQVIGDSRFAEASVRLHRTLASSGSAGRIVAEVERLVAHAN